MTHQEPHATVTARWTNLTIDGFDLETTGTNPEEARIVTATLLRCRPGQPPIEKTWIVDPGIPIPDEAAAVHGWTTDRLKNHPGVYRTADAVAAIGSILRLSLSNMVPVAPFNAAYDFTVLDRELARHGLPPIEPAHGHGIAPVLDARVLDKHVDPYRRAKCDCGCGATDKTLTGLCQHYGVQLTEEDAHTSAGDALAAVRLVPAIIARYPGRFSGYTLEGLHDAQVAWWRKAQLDFERWNQTKNGGAYTDIRPEWPLIPRPTADDPSLQGALL